MIVNIYNRKWVRWWYRLLSGNQNAERAAIAIWPFIFWGPAKETIGAAWRRHEEFHLHHQARWLVIPWFVVYGILYLKYGYWNHPWEVAAREAENAGKLDGLSG